MKSILVVDDSVLTIKMLQAFIEYSYPGAVVVTAGDGASAWNTICSADGKFDIFVIGVSLASMSGIKLVENIKKSQPRTPVILMSGFDEPAGHKADIFLAKPFLLPELLAVIDRLMAVPKP